MERFVEIKFIDNEYSHTSLFAMIWRVILLYKSGVLFEFLGLKDKLISLFSNIQKYIVLSSNVMYLFHTNCSQITKAWCDVTISRLVKYLQSTVYYFNC